MKDKFDRLTESELYFLLKYDFKVHPATLSGMSKREMFYFIKKIGKP
jgi:hypothetical protein